MVICLCVKHQVLLVGPLLPFQIHYYVFSDYLFKLLLIGDSGVGKSCLLLRFAVSVWIINPIVA